MDSLSLARAVRGSVGMLAMHGLVSSSTTANEFRTLAKAALAHASANLSASSPAARPKGP